MVISIEKINWWWWFYSSINKYSYGILEEIMVMVVNFCIGWLDQLNYLYKTNCVIRKLVAKTYFDSCGCHRNTLMLIHLII